MLSLCRNKRAMYFSCVAAVTHFLLENDMKYCDRFTDRLCFKDDEIGAGLSYTARVSEDILTIRLGLYEDTGFSPGEIADILLEADVLNADQIERMKILKMRSEQFESKHYYR